MPGRNAIAIDIGRERLRAILADCDRNRVTVRRLLVEPVPGDLDVGDARAVGMWVGQQLGAAGFPKAKSVMAVAREHVVLKRVRLPTVDARELPEMTRLALQRDLPFDADSAVIDFVRVERGAGSTTVQAAAVPQAALAAARQAARSAGLGVERISLRGTGCAALLGSFDAGGQGGVLAVDIIGERVEFSVVVDGAVRFSRAGELPPADDPAQIADAAVTEARRTWMSYRIVEDADDVRRAVVFGDPRVSELVAGSIGEILGVETSVFDGHPLVDAGAEDLGEAWPLAGLLLAPGIRAETVDFTRPRKAPDVASRRRQLVLAGVGTAAVIVVGAMTGARFHLADLQREVDTLSSQRSAQLPGYMRYWRDRYKIDHLEQWEAAGADWLEHFAYVMDMAPAPDRLVLDSCSGALAFSGVKFDRKSKKFLASKEIKIVLEGEAADRATADAFREALVETEAYQISTAGPDAKSGSRLPYAFQYHLVTADGTPGGSGPDGSPGAGELQAGTDRDSLRRTASRERVE
ncbi:MAG: type IV pilus biogenesis protein PilM [Planctomycetota bacterium]